MRGIQLISDQIRESLRVKKEVDSLQDISKIHIKKYTEIRKGLYELYYKKCMADYEIHHQECSEIWNLLYHSV